MGIGSKGNLFRPIQILSHKSVRSITISDNRIVVQVGNVSVNDVPKNKQDQNEITEENQEEKEDNEDKRIKTQDNNKKETKNISKNNKNTFSLAKLSLTTNIVKEGYNRSFSNPILFKLNSLNDMVSSHFSLIDKATKIPFSNILVNLLR